jgi:phosphatidate cytidylyltransferase
MKRVLTGLVLVPVGVYSAVFAPWWIFVAVVAAVAGLSFYEYARITDGFLLLGLAAGALVLLTRERFLLGILLLLAPAALSAALSSGDLRKSVTGAAMTVAGVLYIFGSWRAGIILHDEFVDTPGRLGMGRPWLLFALMVNWIGDTGAYYIGRQWGRHKLAPAVSPGKSWEGSAAAAAMSVLFGAVYLHLTVPGISIVIGALFGLLANIAGQFGDLAESAIKRAVGVKDSGSMLPGHGGMLDRLDSSLFTMPALVALIAVFHLWGRF